MSLSADNPLDIIMPKSPLFRVLVVAFIVTAMGIWVFLQSEGRKDQALATQVIAKPYVEKKESPSSVATLTIDHGYRRMVFCSKS